MKKILLTAAIAATTLLSSCTDIGESSNTISLYTYSTVTEATKQKYDLYFVTDNNVEFYIQDNRTDTPISDLTVGERMVTGVTIDRNLQESSGIYPASLLEIYPVMEGYYSIVNNDTENSAIADDKLTFIISNMSLYEGYLNMYVGYETTNSDNAKFYLVENLATEPEESIHGYLNLELRYDNGAVDGSDSTAKEYEGHLSFDMSPFMTKLEDMSGIVLRVKTDKSDIVNIRVDGSNL